MTLKEANKLIYFSNGNKKLKGDGVVEYLIFNISAVITCPWRTPECEKKCYAVKAENQYKTCKACRVRNLEATKNDKFVENAINVIEYHLTRKKYKNAKEIRVRIHESGDFYNINYLKAWLEIAKHFESDKRLVFQCYTKSLVLFDLLGINEENKPENFVIHSSLWDDTTPFNIGLIKKLGFPIYTACEPEKVPEYVNSGYVVCECENCTTCKNNCYGGCDKNKVVVIH